jgi:tyrosine-protein phosphatase YwqE
MELTFNNIMNKIEESPEAFRAMFITRMVDMREIEGTEVNISDMIEEYVTDKQFERQCSFETDEYYQLCEALLQAYYPTDKVSE